MKNDKKSFILYNDCYENIKDLSLSDKGLLLDCIFKHAKGDEVIATGIVGMAFSFISKQMDRDCTKYNTFVDKQRANGKLGGRPKKNPEVSQDNPNNPDLKLETQKSLNDTVTVTDHVTATATDIVTDTLKDAKASPFNFKKELLALGVNAEILDDWLTVRKKKKASNTKTAFKGLINEITKSGLMVNDAIECAVENSWSGFKSQWYFNLHPEKGSANNMMDNSANSDWHKGDLGL